MKNVKRLALAAIMMVSGASVMTAQDNVEATVSADVVSDYIWRGTNCGNAAFQPTRGISYKGLSLTGWGSVGIVNSGDTKEFDLTGLMPVPNPMDVILHIAHTPPTTCSRQTLAMTSVHAPSSGSPISLATTIRPTEIVHSLLT